MKRFLTILLVLVLSFSLFVSCDPNTAQKDSNDDDNKPSGGGTSQVEPSIEVPETEAKGDDISEIEVNQLLGSYKGLYDTLIKDVSQLGEYPSKQEIKLTLKFPNGLELATEDDYKKYVEHLKNNAKYSDEQIAEEYPNLTPYTYKNIYLELSGSDYKDDGKGNKGYENRSSLIKYSDKEIPENSEYIASDFKDSRVISDFNIFGYYHGGSYVNGEYVSDSSVLLNSLSGQVVKLNGSYKAYGSENTPIITISTENLEIAINDENKISVKGDIKVVLGDKSYDITLDLALSYDGKINITNSDGKVTAIAPKKYMFTVTNIKITSSLINASLLGTATMSINEIGSAEAFDIIVKYSDELKGKENLYLFAQLDVKSEDINKVNGGNALSLLDCLKIYEFKYSGEEYSAESVKTVIKTMIESMQNNTSNP